MQPNRTARPNALKFARREVPTLRGLGIYQILVLAVSRPARPTFPCDPSVHLLH